MDNGRIRILKIVKIESIRRFWGPDSERYKLYLSFLCSQEDLETLKPKIAALIQEAKTQ